jgi:HlyD family secretion protein
VVISRNVDVGQTVAAALQAPTLLLVAEDLTRMQVDTNVAEADVGKIRPDMVVSFTVDAYPEKSFRGTVRQVRDNAQTVQNVVTYDAVIDVDNRERLLKPGMTASVTFVYATREDALRVSNAAFRFKPDASIASAMPVPSARDTRDARPDQANGAARGGRIVWVLRQGAVSSESLRVGISDGTWTEVIEGGLRAGDEVVTEASAGGPRHAP